MKFKDFIYATILLTYIIIYKYILISFKETYQYIINPLIWLIFAITAYLLTRKTNFYFKLKNQILINIIIIMLIYIILFYSIGYFAGYANNIFATNISGIIINIFSLLFIVIIKEYIRSTMIRKYINKKKLFIYIITIVLIISDLNINLITNSINDFFPTMLKYVFPIIVINMLSTYLSYYGGALTTITYRTLILLPLLIIPIVPKYNEMIPAFADIIVATFIFLIVRIQINKNIKNPDSVSKTPYSWFVYIGITFVFLLFALGTFKYKPIVILSGSMKPIINTGDFVIIKKCDIKNIDIGNIVEYKLNNNKVLHRVIKIVKNKNSIELIVKGDNNLMEDKYPVTTQNLEGCYVFKIKYLGYPTYLIYSIFATNDIKVETGS